MSDRDRVRVSISNNRLSYSWILFQLHLKGIETDKTELSSVLAGTRKGAKAESIVAAAIDILEYYEKCFPIC